MSQIKTMFLVVTDELQSRTFNGKDNKEVTINWQVSDLMLPDKRHPIDYELTYFRPEDIKAPGIYYPSADSFVQGKYGLEAGRYIRWISAEELKEQLAIILAQNTSLSSSPADTPVINDDETESNIILIAEYIKDEKLNSLTVGTANLELEIMTNQKEIEEAFKLSKVS